MADDYLVKPFSFRRITCKNKSLIKKTFRKKVPILEIDDLVLNPNSREVTRQDKIINLTLKEYELLHYLMRDPGRVFGREDIFAHLWILPIVL